MRTVTAWKPQPIDAYAYGELRYFCLQYETKKQFLSPCHPTRDPGVCRTSPTEKERRYRREVCMIEQALRIAASDAATYAALKKNVTQKGFPYERRRR